MCGRHHAPEQCWWKNPSVIRNPALREQQEKAISEYKTASGTSLYCKAVEITDEGEATTHYSHAGAGTHTGTVITPSTRERARGDGGRAEEQTAPPRLSPFNEPWREWGLYEDNEELPPIPPLARRQELPPRMSRDII